MLSSVPIVPSWNDLGGLLAFVRDNPYLFVSSSTVMTTVLVTLALALGAVGTATRWLPWERATAPLRAVEWLAPKLALVLLYFGLGSMALATEILLRFHATAPLETEVQFRSGLGHLAVALVGIAALAPLLRRRSRAEWTIANLWALGYWSVHVSVVTPPWFEFAGQRDLVLGAVKVALAIGIAATLFAWREHRAAPAREKRISAGY